MLLMIAAILLVLWSIGMMMSFTLGGYIHLLLAAAAAVLVVRMIRRDHIPS